jgi:hypothetical protein
MQWRFETPSAREHLQVAVFKDLAVDWMADPAVANGTSSAPEFFTHKTEDS